MSILDNLAIMLIIICLGVIIAIIARKFSILANLNVEEMRSEKEVRFKEQIIGKRLKRNFTKWSSKFVRAASDGASLVGRNFGRMYAGLIKYKEEQKMSAEEKPLSPAEDKNIHLKIDGLIAEAEKFRKEGDFPLAEKKLIEAIGVNSRSIKAFKSLGQVYFEKNELDEAKQIFEHIIKLLDDSEYVHALEAEGGALRADPLSKPMNLNMERGLAIFNLALLLWKMNKPDEAASELKQALLVEPYNPRYLDSMIEISIINKDKIAALEAYATLKNANPENNKLSDFKRQIDEL